MDISVKNAIAISFAAGVVAGCSLTVLLLTLYKIIRQPKQQRQQQQQRPEEERRGLEALDISPPLESSTALLAQDGPSHFSTFFGPSDDYLPMSVYENIQEEEDHYETIPEAEEDHYETIPVAEEDHYETIPVAGEDQSETIPAALEDYYENISSVSRPIPPPPPPPPFPIYPEHLNLTITKCQQ